MLMTTGESGRTHLRLTEAQMMLHDQVYMKPTKETERYKHTSANIGNNHGGVMAANLDLT